MLSAEPRSGWAQPWAIDGRAVKASPAADLLAALQARLVHADAREHIAGDDAHAMV
jgi:hypothetical protein